MGILDKLRSLLVSDEQLIQQKKPRTQKATGLAIPTEITTESVLQALIAHGTAAGYVTGQRHQAQSDALLASVRNQAVKMHEEILGYYRRQNLMPDEKLLNRLTMENMFYLSMGTAILAKVKKTNLIAQGFFSKLLKKSGPELFYREVAAMAGNKYGAANVEELHDHVRTSVIQLLTSFDTQPDARQLVLECSKAMYMYGLTVTITQGQES